MISNKKSYAMKMLQLALALSLLHVDPDDFLQMRLRDWDSQLELREGDGWELEMLRAVPMVEYPYANRKSMMPFIEDTIYFDRQIRNNQQNITAYLLNVQVDSNNSTAALQELQSSAATSTGGGVTVSSGNATTTLEQTTTSTNTITVAASPNASTLGLQFPEIDVFLNSDSMQDQRSIWDQNLADLQDFGDLSVSSPYANLPLKEERSANMVDANSFFEINFDAILPNFAQVNTETTSTTVVDNNVAANNLNNLEGACALNDTFPDPDGIAAIKIEENDEENETKFLDDVASSSLTVTTTATTDEASIAPVIKIEKLEKEVEENIIVKKEEDEEENQVDLSPFISQLEIENEESEIVEVLWKQDVDLGFSLNPPQSSNGTELAGTSSVNAAKALQEQQQQTADNSDDIEKLKALEALKKDKPDFDEKNNNNEDDDMSSEWAGIPFTIDNETGEYIRLPLDELLNDVLQLAQLSENNEIDTDSIASTSKAAEAAKNDLNKKSFEESIDDKENQNNNNNDIDIQTSNKSDKEEDKNSNNNDDDNNDDDLLGLETGEFEDSPLPSPLFDLDDEAKEELAVFDRMLQSPGPVSFHHHHHHHHPGAGTPHHRPGGVQNYAAVGSGANSAFHRQAAAAAAAGFHHGHHHHQGRMPLSRGVSMEQRLQDIASLFNPIPSMGVVGGDMPPYPHYPTPHHYPYQSGASGVGVPQHAQYPPPPPPHHHPHAMLHPNASLGDICSTQPHYGHNLGSAVSSSMHLTNASSHDVNAADAAAAANVGAYKMEHDMMYYSNASSDMNHTTDGLINSFFNDEDLHLMDMNVNDTFCRLVDTNNSTSNNSSVLGTLSSGHGVAPTTLSMSGAVGGVTASAVGITSDLMGATGQTSANGGATGADRLDASSDSAVSSMGSERVPSLSDGEWGEGSDSAQDYHQGKYAGGPYDYSYNNTNRLNDGTRQPPVAQKKHQMFGKRFLQEQPTNNNNNNNTTTANNNANGVIIHNGQAPAIKYEYEPTYPGLQQNGTLLGEGAIGGAGSVGGGAAAASLPPATLSKEQQAYELKYGHHHGAMGGGGAYSLDFSLRTPRTPHEIVTHNHTYTLPQGTGSIPRPQQRDKKHSSSSTSSSSASSLSGMKISKSSSHSRNSEEEHLTRDEKRARALNVPISVYDIINLPMDEFNERLSKYDLSETQLSLIRDIRRRGKNKVAAQNCRKRKLDQIVTLEEDVKEVRRRKDHLQSEHASLDAERNRIKAKFSDLHKYIFANLRDPDGQLYSRNEYSLQQAADGSVFILPKDNKLNATTAGATLLAPPPSSSSHHNSQTYNSQSYNSQTYNSQIHHSSQQQQQHLLAQQNHQHHHHQQHQHHHQQQQQQQEQQHLQQQQQLHQPPTHHTQTHTKD